MKEIVDDSKYILYSTAKFILDVWDEEMNLWAGHSMWAGCMKNINKILQCYTQLMEYKNKLFRVPSGSANHSSYPYICKDAKKC